MTRKYEIGTRVFVGDPANKRIGLVEGWTINGFTGHEITVIRMENGKRAVQSDEDLSTVGANISNGDRSIGVRLAEALQVCVDELNEFRPDNRETIDQAEEVLTAYATEQREKNNA